MGMINYFFVCFSLPDPKIKTECVSRTQKTKSSFAQKEKQKQQQKNQTKNLRSNSLVLPMKYRLYAISVN